ncbi:uncharacterized protein LOC144441517 [Glandiceps talaboti]
MWILSIPTLAVLAVFSQDIYETEAYVCDSEFSFSCGDGNCYPNYLKCDGYPSCPNGEDEDNCGPSCKDCGGWVNNPDFCEVGKYPLVCTGDEACMSGVKKAKDGSLRYFIGCEDKSSCQKLEAKNPTECYKNPVKVSAKCVFCCDDDSCDSLSAVGGAKAV